MDFKTAIRTIEEQGFKAFEIHKKTGLNEAGIRRILNKEILNPQRKTKEILIKFALSISNTTKINTILPKEEYEPIEVKGSFKNYNIDKKLNVMYEVLGTLVEDIKNIKEEVDKIKKHLT